MLIYKVLKETEFSELEHKRKSQGSASDRLDGFIHLSTRKQLPTTLEKHFYKERNLILMAIQSKTISKNLKWEKSRDEDLFPHLYRELHFNDAFWFAPIEFLNDEHILPAGTVGE